MFIQNPVPILKQTKSEMTTNPLIVGDNSTTEESVTYRIRDPILIDTNREFTKTVDEMCEELYRTRTLKLTQRKLKWIIVLLIMGLLIYILINIKFTL